MAYEILTESYGRRLPKITAEADSTDDLATLGTNYAEGSTCVIGDKTYSLDKVQGWIEAGSGGSGGVFWVTFTLEGGDYVADKSLSEIIDATSDGLLVFGRNLGSGIARLYMLNGYSNYGGASFVQIGAGSGEAYLEAFFIAPDGTVQQSPWKWTVEED